MKTPVCPTSTNQSHKLQTYLVGLGGVTLLASTSNAAVVTMDISSISGPNAGVGVGSEAFVDLSTLEAGLIGGFRLYNTPANARVGVNGYKAGAGNLTEIAKGVGTSDPRRFGYGETINATAGDFTTDYQGLFYYGNKVPAWGAGSYLGFRSGNNRYGYLEATWNPDTDTFQIFSGAYESVENASITTPVPEPTTLALLVAGAGGIVALRRRKTAEKA